MSRSGTDRLPVGMESPESMLYDECLAKFLEGTTIRRLQNEMGLSRTQTLGLLKKIKNHFAIEREVRTDQLLCVTLKISQKLCEQADSVDIGTKERENFGIEIDGWLKRADLISRGLESYRNQKRALLSRRRGSRTIKEQEDKDAETPFEAL